MRRFRIRFLFVAAALLVPVCALVLQALRSVELERRFRDQAVAERVFDEMERALSEFLAREEERAFGEYGFVYTPAGAESGEAVRSPLSRLPSLPFVIGYFQIDPDGTAHSPLRPREHERDRTEPRDAPSAETLARIAEVERAAEESFGGSRRASTAAGTAQRPGTTLALDESGPGGARTADALQQQATANGRVSAYDALRALNKGVEQRAERQTKISREYDALSAALGREEQKSQDAARGARNEVSRFELSPMAGRAIDARRLLLYRTVVHETQGYRQGLLLDRAALGSWLRERALGSSEMESYATLRFDASAPTAPGSRYVYRHRFAEPFESLNAELELSPLPGLGGGTYVVLLSAMLGAAVVLALAALYRTASVVLQFAEQRGNFVAAVTHELKTPLTAIRMYGEMLRDGIVPSEAKRAEYYRHITAESERLTRLVNNVLEFSRLQKGPAQPPPPAPAAVAPVVREVAELARPHVEGGGFTLRLELEPDLPPARFERDALMQVLFNLIDNAVKYADGAAPKEITLCARRRREGQVTVAVRDHGPGVSPRHLEKIFEPFYRAESELTRTRKGTGLGLALVRALAERMGAKVLGRNLPEGGFEVEVLFG
jgi:signal transduction histidine kinase